MSAPPPPLPSLHLQLVAGPSLPAPAPQLLPPCSPRSPSLPLPAPPPGAGSPAIPHARAPRPPAGSTSPEREARTAIDQVIADLKPKWQALRRAAAAGEHDAQVGAMTPQPPHNHPTTTPQPPHNHPTTTPQNYPTTNPQKTPQ